MNRSFALLVPLALSSLVGCSSPPADDDSDTDRFEEGIRDGERPNTQSEIDPATGRPVTPPPYKPQPGCGSCGPLPDPWKKFISTTVSDRWKDQNAGGNGRAENGEE